MHFCQLRKHHADPHLTLDGSVLPVVEETKFLGLLFDRKLTFIPHLKYLKAKCLKALKDKVHEPPKSALNNDDFLKLFI